MKRLAHISDLHFGRTDPAVLDGLEADLKRQNPDIVVVSGDLTQRARTAQFLEARAFLHRLPAPVFVIPGNHDVHPMWRPLSRLARPFSRYRRYIARDLCPLHVDDELAILGVNTARGRRWKEGEISDGQLEMIARQLGRVDPALFRIVVTHHPFLPPVSAPETVLVHQARAALAVMEANGVDLLLAGHLHRGYHGDITSHHTEIKRSILVAHASTTTSTRLRGDEPNAYNCITIDGGRIAFHVRRWTVDRFHGDETLWFSKQNNRWTQEGQIGPGLAEQKAAQDADGQAGQDAGPGPAQPPPA